MGSTYRPTSFSMDEALALRDDGLTISEAAARLGVSASALRHWLPRLGECWGPTRWRNMTGRVNECLIEMGITQTEAAEDLGLSGPVVSTLANNKRVLLADGRTFSGPAKRLAEYLGLPPEWLWADLQEEFGTDPRTTPSGLLLGAADNAPSVEERYSQEAEVRRLVAAMEEVLTERGRFVLRERYGLPGAQEEGRFKTLSEVGKMMGLSRERVRQFEREALIHLRDNSGIRDQAYPWETEDNYIDRIRQRAGYQEALDEVTSYDLQHLRAAEQRPVACLPGTKRLLRLGLLRHATHPKKVPLYEATAKGRAVLLAHHENRRARSNTSPPDARKGGSR